jgi:hypothetical protein
MASTQIRSAARRRLMKSLAAVGYACIIVADTFIGQAFEGSRSPDSVSAGCLPVKLARARVVVAA